MRYPDVGWAELRSYWPTLGEIRPDVAEQIEFDADYAGYLERQEADILAFRRDEGLHLDPEIDFAAIAGLSNEARERLSAARPATLGAAGRIPGVTPAALTALLEDVWRRHLLDSAQLYDLAPRPGPWLDFGSGAGLPGLVVALLGAPDAHLVEANARKCAFLNEALRVTGTAATVHNTRIEALAPWTCAVISARALAPLERLLALAAPFIWPKTVSLFPKGQNVEEELTRATKSWRMEVERIASRSDPAGTILRITEVRRVRSS